MVKIRVKILKKVIKLFLVNISICFSLLSGMSGEREWQFVPAAEQLQIPLPRLREQREEFRGNWQFVSYAGRAYQALLAQAHMNINPIVRGQMVQLAQELQNRNEQGVATSSSSSSTSASSSIGTKRKREEVEGKEKEPDEEPNETLRPAKTPRLNDHEIRELLKNEETISLDLFTEENLSVRQGLSRVGRLRIQPAGAMAVPTNLIELVEKYCPNILALHLDGLVLTDVGFKALAKSKMASQLKILGLNWCGLTAQEFITENLNRFENLENLGIGRNPIGDAGFEALAQSKIAQLLKLLGVDTCEITAKSFTAENLNMFKSLECFWLSKNVITDVGFKALAQSKIALQLKRLGIVWCRITAESFTTDNLNRFESLEKLLIGYNHIGHVGFKALAESEIAARLKEIGLRLCRIRSQECTIQNFNKFKSLETLLIGDNLIGDNGFKALAESETAAHLTKLELDLNDITAQEFTIDNLNKFKSLEELSIRDNQLDWNATVALLRSNLSQTLKLVTGLLEDTSELLKNNCPMKKR